MAKGSSNGKNQLQWQKAIAMAKGNGNDKNQLKLQYVEYSWKVTFPSKMSIEKKIK